MKIYYHPASTTSRPDPKSVGVNDRARMPRLRAIVAIVIASGVVGDVPRGMAISTSHPASTRWRATAYPSPPLFPDPHTTSAPWTPLNRSVIAAAAARLARSIKTIDGIR